jgi:SPP1 gp7 family putative phage head morphogenesis protein
MKKKYGRLFDVAAHRIATRMVERLVKHSTRVMRSTAKDTAGFSIPLSAFESEEMREVFKASVEQAVGLIKRIPEQYLDQVQNAVMRSIQSGAGTQTLFDELKKYDVGIKNWAYNTSRDQTTKVYGAVAKQNMLDAGVKKFQWMHSGGGSHPREYHRKHAPEGLNRGIFRFDDPPVIDKKTGEKGFPTQLPNCRCYARPIFDYSED